MIRFEPSFVKGMFYRGCVAGAVAGLLTGVFLGWDVALGVIAGEALFCADLVAMAWLLRRVFEPSGQPTSGSLGLSLLFLLKLLVLFGLAYYFLAVVGLWQVVATPTSDTSEEEVSEEEAGVGEEE
jgi:hypothetical protein